LEPHFSPPLRQTAVTALSHVEGLFVRRSCR